MSEEERDAAAATATAARISMQACHGLAGASKKCASAKREEGISIVCITKQEKDRTKRKKDHAFACCRAENRAQGHHIDMHAKNKSQRCLVCPTCVQARQKGTASKEKRRERKSLKP